MAKKLIGLINTKGKTPEEIANSIDFGGGKLTNPTIVEEGGQQYRITLENENFPPIPVKVEQRVGGGWSEMTDIPTFSFGLDLFSTGKHLTKEE